jgi:hypothetical protein
MTRRNGKKENLSASLVELVRGKLVKCYLQGREKEFSPQKGTKIAK